MRILGTALDTTRAQVLAALGADAYDREVEAGAAAAVPDQIAQVRRSVRRR